ncbi:VOC family protein [Piscinibacter gummiphilus]|uniref:Uncharacterized protein n=1 Tax=Piscinibacter gummiphilus TaxID=946333 RepID=A0A1W6L9C3_9BURK|nr:VOC family protein [Piscinibacter gummiphilus]ARN20899.1 hypothetical protein A4W93_13885 [Piscinibacter gummiphilus]ATU65574.1 hypothetical protein CPZ87_13965 [Piscinibacter gummiphilus]GLS94741.1 hypothetical protein GCM10007918_20330 [Piscinibacter gummiphilus]
MNKSIGWATVAVVGAMVMGCGGDDDEVVAAPVAPAAVVDPCPALEPAAGAVPTASATGAYLCAANVGVADLERAVTFYKALGMREKARLKRTDRDEVVMASADARGSHLVLFKHSDTTARDYSKNPGKIVFYVKDPAAFGAALAAAGGTLTSPPVLFQGTMVGFGRDPDNNLVEIAGSAVATHSYLSAFGIGVTDLEAARAYYIDVLDFKQTLKLSVTKPNGAGGVTPWYDEYILSSPTAKGSAVVLMHYTDGSAKNYTNNPVSLSLRVSDPVAYAKRITDAGGTVPAAPAKSAEAVLGGIVASTAKDADGTQLHLYKSPQAAPCGTAAITSASTSTTGAYLCSAGVGVTDLEKSVAFYKAAFGMTERVRLTRTDRDEVVLDAADKRGAQLVLYKHTDGSTRNYKQNPGKIVFYVSDTPAAVAAVVAAGGSASTPANFNGSMVSFSRDPDNNLVEIASSAAATTPYVSAFGIGVADLEAAKTFYVDTLDMKLVAPKLSIAKAANTPWYDEYILGSKAGRGASIVLMTYTDGTAKNYKDNPVTLGLRADRPGDYAKRIFDAGKTVTRAPAAATEAALGDALVGYAKDADGTVLEILSSPN